MKHNTEIAENLIRALLKNITPNELFVGLSNAFFHGDILNECNYAFEEEDLHKLYLSFDSLIKDSTKIT